MPAVDDRDSNVRSTLMYQRQCGTIELGWFLDVKDVVMRGAERSETTWRRPAERMNE